MKRSILFLLIATLAALAQPPGARGPGPGGPPPQGQMSGGPPNGAPNNQAQQAKWWLDPMMARRIGLSPDQQGRLERVFQQYRMRLMELSDALDREESTMAPMLDGDRPDENRVLAQIDRVANARAEFEKANGRMLLAMRALLNADQWRRLQAEDGQQGPPPGPPPGRGR